VNRILVVGEDDLSCALGQKILSVALPNWSLAGPLINTRGVTKLSRSIPRYVKQARFVQPVLCIADTDQDCPVKLLSTWMPMRAEKNFFLRLAVPESESWVLADRERLAEFFGIAVSQIPHHPEQISDPKREVLRLARKSKVRQIREEVISQTNINKQGSGYNLHLCAFVRDKWRADRASERSPSLARALHRLAKFGEQQG